MNVVRHRRRREAGFGETRPDEICTRRKWSLDTASVCEAASAQIISRSKRQTRFGMNVVTAGQCLLSRLTDQRGIQQKQKLSRTTFLRQQSGSQRRVEVHLLPTRPRQKPSHFAPNEPTPTRCSPPPASNSSAPDAECTPAPFAALSSAPTHSATSSPTNPRALSQP